MDLWRPNSLCKWIARRLWNNFSRKSFYPKDANLSSVWINYQEVGEHNPEHIHSSADLSFVIYLKVPKEIEFNNFHVIKDHAFYPPGIISFNYCEYHHLAVSGRYLSAKETLFWCGRLFEKWINSFWFYGYKNFISRKHKFFRLIKFFLFIVVLSIKEVFWRKIL